MILKTFELSNGKYTAEGYNKHPWQGGRLHVVGEYATEAEAVSSLAGLIAGWPTEWTPVPLRLARWG